MQISYILARCVVGDELPARLDAYGTKSNTEPIYRSMGIDVESALRPMVRFSGQSIEDLEGLIHYE